MSSFQIIICYTIELHFYIPVIYIFPPFATFSGPINFPMFIMYCVPQFYVSEISNFPRFMSLERLQMEQFWHIMAPTEKLVVSTYFVTYYYHHPLVSHPSKMNMYIALQNKNCVSLGETINSMPCKLVFSRNVMNCVKSFYVTVLSAVLKILQWGLYIINIKYENNSFYNYLKIKC
jgi:hypothetical protein